MWRWVGDTRQGISHRNRSLECQDRVHVERGETCVAAALADGLGSLKDSATAAEAAVRSLCEWFARRDREELDRIFKDSETAGGREKLSQRLVKEAEQAVQQAADEKGQALDSMNCTLVFVCIAFHSNQALAGRIGDSAVCCIRQDGKSEAMADDTVSANFTDALLGSGAAEKMKFRVYSLSDPSVAGFFLTSDGLSNEVYMKGSRHVCHNAEGYFNSLCGKSEKEAVALNARRLDALLEERAKFFQDDISYLILSRVSQPVSLPQNPTWLCTCGERNELWERYCRRCHMDFVKLYKGVDFSKTEKADFFSKLNADEARERRLIGLPSGENSTLPRLIVRAVLAAAVLALLLWNVFSIRAMRKEIRQISEELDAIQAALEAVDAGQERKNAVENTEPDRGDAQEIETAGSGTPDTESGETGTPDAETNETDAPDTETNDTDVPDNEEGVKSEG